MNGSICNLGDTLIKVLESINQQPAGVAFVNDGNQKLCGILTDGDIRRLLLNGVSVTTPLSSEHLNDFTYAHPDEDIEALLHKTNKKVRIVPIVDENMILIDYFRYEHKTRFIPIAEPNLNGNELKYVTDAVLSTWISSKGEYIDRFESEFADYCDCKYGVAVSNGTVAIHLALVTIGIGRGDEVIVPDFTFAATINAIVHSGATPVIVDVDRHSWCIDPNAIEQAISPKTKCIIPVHIYGQPCDMDAITKIAKANNLFVVEDAAQAHGAKYKGKKVGSIGDAATFSFFGNKLITCGEGGMVVTNSKEIRDKMHVLRDHGMRKDKRYWHDFVGYNYRMTNMQAAVGCAQLEKIDNTHLWRSELEKAYKLLFKNIAFRFQEDFDDRTRSRWLISGLMSSEKERNEIIDHFGKHNVDLRPFFYPLSEMPLYKRFASQSCVVSKKISQMGLSLPTIQGINLNEIRSLVSSWNYLNR